MRVCMVTHSLYESDGRVTRYAEALAARGDEVEVIALRKSGKPKEEVIAGVRVFRIQSRSFTETKKVSFLKQVSMFFLKAFWLVSWRQLRKPYDLLHMHSIPDHIVFTGLLPKLMGAKVILDIHDILPELYASKFGVTQQSIGFKTMLFLERISAAFSDHVIIANHLWKDRLLARSVRSDRHTVLLNYPDTKVFHPMKCDRSSGKFVMIYPGTLNQHQGLDVAIRAFAVVRQTAPKVEFHIYGEGRTQSALMRLAEELGLQDSVQFHKFVPQKEIARVMANADLAVVPKRADSFGNEAFSTKVFEFMALGVPVVVSNTKIDRYYFNDSVVKFFQDGDERDLARCILLLMNDESLRAQLVKNASEFVKTYDWELNKGTYLGVVDSLLDRKPRPQRAALPKRNLGDAA